MTAVCCAFWVWMSATTLVTSVIWVLNVWTSFIMSLLVKNSLSEASEFDDDLVFQARSVSVSASAISSLVSGSAIGVSSGVFRVLSEL